MMYKVECDVILKNLCVAARQSEHVVVYMELYANVKNTNMFSGVLTHMHCA